MKKNCSYLIFYLVLVIPIIVLIMPASAWSATFNVATVSDLENALTAAQQNGEDDTIIVAAGTYDVSGGTLTYVASSVGAGENFALTIEGAGTGQTVIDGGNAAQCLSILTSTGVFDDSAAPITIRDISFQNGAASNNGGGANIRTLNASITIENSVFDSNDSNVGNSDGGGLSVRTWGTGTIMISGITASNNVSGGGGAGVYTWAGGGDITVMDSIFVNNTVTSDNTGGGLFAQSTSAGVVVTVMGCTFTGNEALSMDAMAGGSYTETSSTGLTIFVNNTLSGNSSEYGGGAYFNGGPMTVANNTLSGNHSETDGGGMLFEMQGGTADISNNIVWGNTAVGLGADIRFGDGDPSDIAILNNNDYGILSSFGGGTVTEEATNISLNPLFVATSDPDPSNWNLHLTESSPAIDTGDNTLIPAGTPTDKEGDSRTIDGNGNGTATVDMGSDEYSPPLIIAASGSGGDGGGGGCSLRDGAAFDPLMPLMLLFAVLYLINRHLNPKRRDI